MGHLETIYPNHRSRNKKAADTDMTNEIRVPMLPESVTEATVLDWHFDVGQPIHRDDIVVELETDKVVLEVPAPQDGKLLEILCPTGEIGRAHV